MTEIIVIKNPSPELIKFLDEKREKQKKIIKRIKEKINRYE